MNLKALALALVALGAPAIADEHTRGEIQQIKQATVGFYQIMADWDGSYLGAVPILTNSRSLANQLKNGMTPESRMKAARAACSLEVEQESMGLARSLAQDVGDAIDMAITIEPKMEGIPVAGKPVGKMILRDLHTASQSLSKDFTSRARPENQEEAQAIVQEINEHFLRGIAAFE